MLFLTKSPVVEAVQWDGVPESPALAEFAGHWVSFHESRPDRPLLTTQTAGAVSIGTGDWVVRRSPNSDFIVMSAAEFAMTYAPVGSDDAEIRAAADRAESVVKDLRKLAAAAYAARLKAQTAADRIVYAATSRCPCGAGLAFDPLGEDEASPFVGPLSGYWDCSKILLGTADRAAKHTGRLPFSFYNVKSEEQPSANGATTRPDKDTP